MGSDDIDAAEVSGRIAAVLSARRAQEPLVEREIAYWERVADLLAGLELAVRDVRSAQAGARESAAIAQLADLDVPELRKIASQTLAALAGVRARVSRPTINIGVSGRARNGKSTLLQSLSGLGDDQIPTGRGDAVTAVRSTIYHSLTRTQALLTMHSEASFCELVLGPYHEELRLLPPPRSVSEFAAYRYPQTARALDIPGGPQAQQAAAPMLRRLLEMHESLPLYRQLLTGQAREAELPALREWVAYPPATAPEGQVPERRYLAVRGARITCAFPLDRAIDLGLVDLPGLGELAANAEAHHLAGLVNDVDFVMLVKRPMDTNELWSDVDNRAATLTGRAAGAASTRDFLTILVNSGGCPPENVAALQRNLTNRVNEGADGRFYQVITADAADRDDVRRRVLGPVLDHLATALPQMDAAVTGHARELSATSRQRLLATTGQLLAALRTVLTPTPTEALLARARQLQTEVAFSLQEWVEQLRERAAEGYEDDEFYQRTEEVRASIRDWILDGFGEGQGSWTGRALGEMRLHRSSASFAEQALNSIRVEIARRFSAIDDVLLRRRQEFWAGLLAALGPQLGALSQAAPGAGPDKALEAIARGLREAPDPCLTLAESLELALDVRLDYRTRVLPQVRRALEVLLPHPGDGRSTELASLLDIPLTADGAVELYGAIRDMARQAVHDAGRVLVREPGTTGLVLFAYGEQFEDSFIRSDQSEGEFLRVTEAFTDQMWPAEATGPATTTATVQHARMTLVNLRRALEEGASGPATGERR
ncbi:MAG TPA: hypothetical protein VH478_12980 [Trebonia sp.]|jgi:hypothetical protein|nr:hypothetical protein [Trebonia sp.]